MDVLVDESRSYKQNTPRQIFSLGIEQYYFFINGTAKNTFEILYTAFVLCGHEDELNWNKWTRKTGRMTREMENLSYRWTLPKKEKAKKRQNTCL